MLGENAGWTTFVFYPYFNDLEESNSHEFRRARLALLEHEIRSRLTRRCWNLSHGCVNPEECQEVLSKWLILDDFSRKHCFLQAFNSQTRFLPHENWHLHWHCWNTYKLRIPVITTRLTFLIGIPYEPLFLASWRGKQHQDIHLLVKKNSTPDQNWVVFIVFFPIWAISEDLDPIQPPRECTAGNSGSQFQNSAVCLVNCVAFCGFFREPTIKNSKIAVDFCLSSSLRHQGCGAAGWLRSEGRNGCPTIGGATIKKNTHGRWMGRCFFLQWENILWKIWKILLIHRVFSWVVGNI